MLHSENNRARFSEKSSVIEGLKAPHSYSTPTQVISLIRGWFDLFSGLCRCVQHLHHRPVRFVAFVKMEQIYHSRGSVQPNWPLSMTAVCSWFVHSLNNSGFFVLINSCLPSSYTLNMFMVYITHILYLDFLFRLDFYLFNFYLCVFSFLSYGIVLVILYSLISYCILSYIIWCRMI